MENQENNSLLETWVKIGKANIWISEAVDPPFSRKMLVRCNSIEILQQMIGRGNWCLGQGFYYQNLCFINQISGGDEWLTIKNDYAFESFTFEGIIKRGEFPAYIERLLKATRKQCIDLEY